jgi:hypothetical protein
VAMMMMMMMMMMLVVMRIIKVNMIMTITINMMMTTIRTAIYHPPDMPTEDIEILTW